MGWCPRTAPSDEDGGPWGRGVVYRMRGKKEGHLLVAGVRYISGGQRIQGRGTYDWVPGGGEGGYHG